MVPDSVTVSDIGTFVDELYDRMLDLLEEEENV